MSAANNVKLLACHTAFLQNVSREGDFQRFNAFALYEQYGYALTQERPSRGHEIYNFGRGFRSHHYYLQWILDRYVDCLSCYIGYYIGNSKRINHFLYKPLQNVLLNAEPRYYVVKKFLPPPPNLYLIFSYDTCFETLGTLMSCELKPSMKCVII